MSRQPGRLFARWFAIYLAADLAYTTLAVENCDCDRLLFTVTGFTLEDMDYLMVVVDLQPVYYRGFQSLRAIFHENFCSHIL